MPTLGDTLGALEEELFVGRQRELAAFEEWLVAAPPAPAILDVSGRGGIDKTALLRAFGRRVRRLGKPVAFADSRDFPHTPAGLLGALAPREAADPLAYLNTTRPLILLDTCEELGALRRYLQEEFLPRLDSGVKLVLAGRYPLGEAWGADSPWRRLVRSVPLDGLTAAESSEYLSRRGIEDTGLREQVTAATGGNPLALTLAADLALLLGAHGFAAAPERRLAVRTLVEQLLRDVRDAPLRELLEACAVVRQFDEATLAALTGREEIGAAFAQLCRLAVVRPGEHGLTLHDDVRRALAEDLRWRRPERYNTLRLRALAYYRERMQTAPPAEREWLLAERLYLCENALVQALLFQEAEPGEVWVEPGRPEDHATVLDLWDFTATSFFGPELGFEPDELLRRLNRESLAMVLDYEAKRLRIARDREGRAVGFTLVVPVCQESLPPLMAHPLLVSLIDRYWRPEALAELPVGPDVSNIHYLITCAYTDVRTEGARAALLRDVFGLLALGGVYLVNVARVPPPAPDAAHRAGFLASWMAVMDLCGFEPVEGVRLELWEGGPAIEGRVLDLSRIGVDAWLEAIISGRPVPRALRPAELERELLAVLTHWHDDARLAQSPLREQITLPAAAAGTAVAESLRQVIGQALARAKAQANAEQELAYRALELAYLQRATSHERAARRLSVSPRTFYRLLKRGVQGLAAALSAESS